MHLMHRRWSRPGSALAAGLVLATVLSAAPAGAQAPAGPDGQPRRGSVTVVPLSADLQITRAIVYPDGQRRVEHETNKLYRDSHGRTRTEDGSSVTISDPASGTTIVLDTEAHTFQRTTSTRTGPESAAPRPEDATASDRQITSKFTSLGSSIISGVPAEGKAHTVTTPARGKFPAREREVTTWSSAEVQLPVRTRVVETSGYVYEQTYTNIQAGSVPESALFEVPNGYRQTDRAAATQPTPAGTQAANCPIDYLDPIVLVTFYPFIMYSPVPAVTDVNQGCVFIADQARWQYPLILVPETPLLLPVDIWGAWYLGDWVPWLPYIAFGDVAFAAASTQDATVVDSLIILEIF